MNLGSGWHEDLRVYPAVGGPTIFIPLWADMRLKLWFDPDGFPMKPDLRCGSTLMLLFSFH